MKEKTQEVATQNVLVSANGDMVVIAGVINETFEYIKDLLEDGKAISKIILTREELSVDFRVFDDNWKYWEVVADKSNKLYFRLNGCKNNYYIKLEDLVHNRCRNQKVIDLHKLSLIYHILQEHIALNEVI